MNTETLNAIESKPRVLLSSVFGPYAQDDEYGSRKINPMELFHNQVTRVQGVFSLRMFHPSLGLMLIKENIKAPCTLLDFPNLKRFIEEIKGKFYDIIGISAIVPNLGKVKKMCDLIRQYQPNAKIVVGGHIANMPELENRISVDHIVKGEGVQWFRKFLGENVDAPIKHPVTSSAFGARVLGIPLLSRPGDVAAALIPSVGCPMGCNFCATSHLFGGKGKSFNFYETGDELYSVICDLEKKLNARSFFVMDENFLLNRKRTLRLLELMKENNKSWSFRIFSSARVVKSYTDEQLLRLGVSWVWMGIEGENSQYSKLNGIDTKELVNHLQSIGIRVLGSTIIGLENHTPENIEEAIEWASDHNTVFHQFMLYSPVPGTPLYAEHRENNTLLSEEDCPLPDTHGQHRFNFRHQYIKDQQETDLLLKAFQLDFEKNGPSLLRHIQTTMTSWMNLKDHPDDCIRDRVNWESRSVKTVYAAALWAMRKMYKNDKRMKDKIVDVLNTIHDEFGLTSVLLTKILGPFLYTTLKLENRRLQRGWTYEPRTLYSKNDAAIALENRGKAIKDEMIKKAQLSLEDLTPVKEEVLVR